ncbi:MAG: polysaccharide biosynthesis/export family protein [Chromatiaceae bacterium]|nr:polysaccharide biosynthesis/export family protein [Chromatiaceae bacterium]
MEKCAEKVSASGKSLRLWWVAALLGYASSGFALGISAGGNLPGDKQAESLPETVDEQQRTDWRTGSYGVINGNKVVPDDGEIRPFGAHLFNGGFSGVRADGLNPDYRLVPGDQVTLRIWGAVEIERILPIDAQGNIFVPSIGPVKVQGLSNQELNGRVRAAVQKVYPENVHVYTNLQGVQPVALFVTGYVNNPGRYAGTPDNSLLYFIAQAGGIDDLLGSYRHIRVLRNGKSIARADLYDFISEGKLVRPQLRDGDTIMVEKRGPDVIVTGDVERAYRFELTPSEMTGAVLLELARLKPDVSHVLLRGNRETGPVSYYLSVEEFQQQRLQHGDEVLFSADQRDESIVVQLEGSFYGPSRFALPRDVHLREFLDSIPVPPELTAIENVSMRRVSVAERQKQALRESFRRLQATYLGVSSETPDEAKIRIQEAELINQFVARAERVVPNGRLVVAVNDQISDIRLQDGDVITLPEKSDSILISGEVLVPQSVVYKADTSALEYIEGAGGFTEHANPDQVLVVRQNGEVRNVKDVVLRSGDEILVLPKAPTKNLQLATSISQILYQIAVATKVVLGL